MSVYTDRSDHDANQGDVFAEVPFGGFSMDGMITSHDCVCDKPGRLPEEEAAVLVISVAPVHRLDELTGGRYAAARDGGMPRYFFLPEEDGRPDLVADLYLEQPVRYADVVGCARVTSLSPEWLGRLWQQFIRLRLGEDYVTFLRELVDAS